MVEVDGPTKRAAGARRVLMLLTAAALALIAVAVDPLARQGLDGRPVDLGLLQLKLAYNSGVAFSAGANLPVPVVLAVTAAITIAVGCYAWRTAAQNSTLAAAGLAAIFAGALSNVIDRGFDGKVTDYFHTGWWPTFNLADTYIVCGAVVFVATMLLAPPDGPSPSR